MHVENLCVPTTVLVSTIFYPHGKEGGLWYARRRVDYNSRSLAKETATLPAP